MAARKKINKFQSQVNDPQAIEIWGILSQKPSHALVKAISDKLEIKFDLIEHKEFHIFSNPPTLFLIKNHKDDFFSEIDVDYLLVIMKNTTFHVFDSTIFQFLKTNHMIQGAYSLSLPSKTTNKILKLLQSL